MTVTDARKLLHVMTAAWPWAEWPEDHVALWLAALQAHEFGPARLTVNRAINECERPPSFHWFHTAAKAEADRHVVYTPELEAVPVDGEQGKRLAAAAREALHKRMPASLGEAIRQHRDELRGAG